MQLTISLLGLTSNSSIAHLMSAISDWTHCVSFYSNSKADCQALERGALLCRNICRLPVPNWCHACRPHMTKHIFTMWHANMYKQWSYLSWLNVNWSFLSNIHVWCVFYVFFSFSVLSEFVDAQAPDSPFSTALMQNTGSLFLFTSLNNLDADTWAAFFSFLAFFLTHLDADAQVAFFSAFLDNLNADARVAFFSLIFSTPWCRCTSTQFSF